MVEFPFGFSLAKRKAELLRKQNITVLVRGLRERTGLTQEKFVAKLGVTSTTSKKPFVKSIRDLLLPRLMNGEVSV